MKNLCRRCGAELPENASFCPHCETPLGEKRPVRPPHPWRWKAVICAGILLVGLGIFLTWRWVGSRPETYDPGAAELVYEDGGTTYHLLLSFYSVDGIPEPQEEKRATVSPSSDGGRSACPSQLYVYDEATGENCRERFREKVAALSVETIPVGNSQTMEHTGAVQDDPRMPYSLASTEVLYEAEDGSDEVRWTLTMENGDVIVLRHYLSIRRISTLSYQAEDVPMETAEELQALLDRIDATVDDSIEVTIYLPTVTYDQPISMQHPCCLLGSLEGDTVFTQPVTIGDGEGAVVSFQNLIFAGSGAGTGLATGQGLILYHCLFENWEVGIASLDGSWVTTKDCGFRKNDVGLRINTLRYNFSDSAYTGNRFEENGTGIVIEQLGGDWVLDFSGCVFAATEQISTTARAISWTSPTPHLNEKSRGGFPCGSFHPVLRRTGYKNLSRPGSHPLSRRIYWGRGRERERDVSLERRRVPPWDLCHRPGVWDPYRGHLSGGGAAVSGRVPSHRLRLRLLPTPLKGEGSMRIVVWKSPKALRGLLRRLFRVEEG